MIIATTIDRIFFKAGCLAGMVGVHRITFRLPSCLRRGFSKKRGECDNKPDPPCVLDRHKPKPECQKKRKIKCYCLKPRLKNVKECGLKCNDVENIECRRCKRFEICPDPEPKRESRAGLWGVLQVVFVAAKKEKLVRPRKPKPKPKTKKLSLCRRRKEICSGKGACPPPKFDYEYGPNRADPPKQKKKKPTGETNNTRNPIAHASGSSRKM